MPQLLAQLPSMKLEGIASMETTNNLIESARSGDTASQKILLDQCQQSIITLTYKNLRNAAKYNMDYDDLKELSVPAFVKALNTYDPTRISFFDYFKYLYLMQIKTEFRYRSAKKNKSLQVDNIPNIDEDYAMQFQSPLYKDNSDNYDDIDKKQIYQIVVNERQVKMTDKEYEIIKMFFEDIEVSEMARRLNKNYTETFRSLKKAIDKIKKYFESQI